MICVLDKGIVTPVLSLPDDPGWGVAFLEGLGGAEGAHVGIGIQPLGVAALDAYFRLLLAHLSMFRSVVDHPGFGWGKHLPKGMVKVAYLTSITNETDPEKRRERLEQYATRAREEFKPSEVPPDWPKEP